MPDSQPQSDAAGTTPRFAHPGVMLIDLTAADADLLVSAGYRVTQGTLGTPYRVTPGDGYEQLWRSSELDGLTEQEVVVIDLTPPAVADQPVGVPPTPTAETTVWASCSSGIIDPRPIAAHYSARKDISRILEHGGVVVAFAGPKFDAALLVGRRPPYSMFQVDHQLDITAWNAVPYLDYFQAETLRGHEIKALTGNTVVASLGPHLEGASYNCKLSPAVKDSWFTLATNKFGDVVAGLQVGRTADDKGLVFVLPRVASRGATVKLLLDEILPELRPKLFPESDRMAWRHQAPYELAEVRRLKDEIEAIRAEATNREGELQAEIEKVQSDQKWVLDLVSATGDELVTAVKLALEELGFEDVSRSDDEVEGADDADNRLREDLQIAGSPLVLVEVKGIGHRPREEDTLAVTKYMAPRMRQLDRTDVRGLAVINHERGLPPMARENTSPFQSDVLTNADHHDFTVITGFDLYRLVIGKRQLGWQPEDVLPLFYEAGRVAPIPKHYELVGVVENFFEQVPAVGVRVCGAGFSVGDILAYEGPIAFVEEQAASLRIDDRVVEAASDGDGAGIKTGLTKEEARVGARVFRASR